VGEAGGESEGDRATRGARRGDRATVRRRGRTIDGATFDREIDRSRLPARVDERGRREANPRRAAIVEELERAFDEAEAGDVIEVDRVTNRAIVGLVIE